MGVHWDSTSATYVDFKEAHDSVMSKVLYNIVIEFGMPLKLFKLIKMCLVKSI